MKKEKKKNIPGGTQTLDKWSTQQNDQRSPEA